MLTVNEAFRKFKGRLELNDKEQRNASSRHKEVREFLDTKFEVARSFLTGSYARWTKTKPLKDIDIFFELKEDEEDYRSKNPSVVIGDFHDALVEKYGDDAVRKQTRSVGWISVSSLTPTTTPTTGWSASMSYRRLPLATTTRFPTTTEDGGSRPIRRSTPARPRQRTKRSPTNGRAWFGW